MSIVIKGPGKCDGCQAVVAHRYDGRCPVCAIVFERKLRDEMQASLTAAVLAERADIELTIRAQAKRWDSGTDVNHALEVAAAQVRARGNL